MERIRSVLRLFGVFILFSVAWAFSTVAMEIMMSELPHENTDEMADSCENLNGRDVIVNCWKSCEWWGMNCNVTVKNWPSSNPRGFDDLKIAMNNAHASHNASLYRNLKSCDNFCLEELYKRTWMLEVELAEQYDGITCSYFVGGPSRDACFLFTEESTWTKMGRAATQPHTLGFIITEILFVLLSELYDSF